MTDTATETEIEMKSYTVMAGAVMLTIGRKANGEPEVVRLTHGQTLNADPNDERVLELLAIKCIAPASSEAAKRGATVTVRMVSKGMDGEDALVPAAQPLAADLPPAAPAMI